MPRRRIDKLVATAIPEIRRMTLLKQMFEIYGSLGIFIGIHARGCWVLAFRCVV